MSKSIRPPFLAGHYYHLYNRGAHRASIFHERTNFLFVISNLKKYASIFDLTLIAYCLLPNHYHLLVRQDGDKRAGLLPQHTFNSYSKAYNKKYGHSGTLFEGPYKADLIKGEGHLRHLCRYIHANAVKHGFVSDPAAWPYSNYLDWIGARSGTLVAPDFIQTFFGTVDDYQRFVEDYLESLI